MISRLSRLSDMSVTINILQQRCIQRKCLVQQAPWIPSIQIPIKRPNHQPQNVRDAIFRHIYPAFFQQWNQVRSGLKWGLFFLITATEYSRVVEIIVLKRGRVFVRANDHSTSLVNWTSMQWFFSFYTSIAKMQRRVLSMNYGHIFTLFYFLFDIMR